MANPGGINSRFDSKHGGLTIATSVNNPGQLAGRDSGVQDGSMQFMLAKDWTGENPKGWWLSEKLDGIRAYWDGEQLWSRLGNAFEAPKCLTDHLPHGIALDGELWLGRHRGALGQANAIVKSGQGWERFQFHLFDAPEYPEDFALRYRYLARRKWTGPVSVCEQTQCRDVGQLERAVQGVFTAAGEGIVLRADGSDYIGGRSSDYLRIKPHNWARYCGQVRRPTLSMDELFRAITTPHFRDARA